MQEPEEMQGEFRNEVEALKIKLQVLLNNSDIAPTLLESWLVSCYLMSCLMLFVQTQTLIASKQLGIRTLS